MSDPMTPAALPRNREADAWRAKYEDEARWSNRGWAACLVFAVGMVVVSAKLNCARDAARAQVAAAEQRAERAEARARDVASACRETLDVFWRFYVRCREGTSPVEPPRVIYDDVGTAPVARGIIPAGPVTMPGTIPPCPQPVGTLCLYDGDRGQP